MTPPPSPSRLAALAARIRTSLASPRILVLLPLLALVLGSPSLPGGLALDDLLLTEHLAAGRDLTALYDFGGSAEVAAQRASGAFPWWTADDLHVRFLRPLAAATLALDETSIQSNMISLRSRNAGSITTRRPSTTSSRPISNYRLSYKCPSFLSSSLNN